MRLSSESLLISNSPKKAESFVGLGFLVSVALQPIVVHGLWRIEDEIVARVNFAASQGWDMSVIER